MRQISLNEKLVVYFVMLSITGLIIVAVFSFRASREAVLNRTFAQLTSVKINKKKQIESFINDRLRDAKFISAKSEITGTCRFLENPENGNPESLKTDLLINAHLISYLSNSGYYHHIVLLNQSGKSLILNVPDKNQNPTDTLVVSTGTLPQRIVDEAFRSETMIHDLTLHPELNQPVFYVSALVPGTYGECALLLEISLAEIDKIMLENSAVDGLGQSGESYIAGSDRLMRSQSRFHEKSTLNTNVNTSGFVEAIQGNTGTAIINDYRGISVLSSYGPIDIPGLNWVILTEIDTAEAMRPVYNLRTDFILIALAIAILIFVFAFILSRRITKPIIRLSSAAGNIATGKLDINLPVCSNDEIGELTDTFNKMAQQLKQQKDALATERTMRLRSMIDGQENERQRLSRDLHDGLGQSLIAIKLQLENLCSNFSSAQNEGMGKVKNYIEQTIEDIRRISNDLAPSVLQAFGLTTALRNLCHDLSVQSDKKISFGNTGKIPDINTKTAVYLYRICQEALSNAVKHSGATNIDVELKYSGQTVYLQIKDNGKGFEIENLSRYGGNGINNIRERAQLLNAVLQILSDPGIGTRIRLECKLQNMKNHDQ